MKIQCKGAYIRTLHNKYAHSRKKLINHKKEGETRLKNLSPKVLEIDQYEDHTDIHVGRNIRHHVPQTCRQLHK
jgi:hypothetical protein